MANVLSQYGEQNGLVDFTQAASGVAGILNGAKLYFYTNNIVPAEGTPLASFDLSPDANLSAIVLTWGAAYRRAGGGIQRDAQAILAQLASGANAGPLYGYIVELAAGAQWIYGEAFVGGPITLTDTLDGFVLVPKFALGGGSFGEGSVIR